MVPRRLSSLTALLLVAMGLPGRGALAAPISFSGYVAKDFDPATNADVKVTPVSSNALNIGQSQWITNNGWVSGWSIQDIRTYYNSTTDTLYVGVNTFANANGKYAPFGQANGDPTGSATPYDPAHLGGDKSIAIAFAPVSLSSPTTPGSPVIVAGVPADKTLAGTGTNGFTVSNYNATTAATSGLAYSFGSALPTYTGTLTDPTSANPQLEFTIKNFSQIPGLNGKDGFWISAYAGSAVDGVAGESYLAWSKVPANAQQNIPEPATWLAWTLVGGAAAWRYRGRRNRVHA